MNAICRHLANRLAPVFETRVAALERQDGRWSLTEESGLDLGQFDAVVVSVPAPQAARLLRDAAPALAARAERVEMSPCWAVMASFSERLAVEFDAAFVHDSPLSWVARNDSKPRRPRAEAWVLHGSPEWSACHLEHEGEEVAQRLLTAFHVALGDRVGNPEHLVAHRWRHALPAEPLADPCLFDPELRVGACGDWCGGPRVEGAFLSGLALADRLLTLRR
jgi:predicted NAD/FAD-dependent oxidoreductase